MGTMHRCTSFALATAVLALGCATGEKAASTDSARGSVAVDTGARAAPAAGATADLSKFAGRWQVHTKPVSGRDTTTMTYTLTATGDTTGWTVTYPGRAAMPVHASVAGDSVMLATDPYPSVRRKGLTVHTNSVLRMQGDRLVGTAVAHFKTSQPDSVIRSNTEATRMP